jgi:hypothetical protein
MATKKKKAWELSARAFLAGMGKPFRPNCMRTIVVLRRNTIFGQSIFNISKRKNFVISKGLEHDFWISNLAFDSSITVAHILEFSTLWNMIQDVHLNDEPDAIT